VNSRWKGNEKMEFRWLRKEVPVAGRKEVPVVEEGSQSEGNEFKKGSLV
jgi:hypothetical protein